MAEGEKCSVCMEEHSKLAVTCCNGHKICEKHYLQRYKAIYEEGREAFNDDHAQKCFMCRTPMEDARFSQTYDKNLKLLVALDGGKMMCKKYGKNFDEFKQSYHELALQWLHV